jgi:hypothetical protein
MSLRQSSKKVPKIQCSRTVRLSRNIGFVILIIVVAALTAGSSCSKRMNQASKNVPPLEATIEFCDLVRKPDDYDSKTVRVRSLLIGYHELALYSADCDSQIRYIRADFNPKTRKQLVQGVSELGDSGMRRGNFWVTVTALGRFERIPESDCQKLLRESEVPDHYYPNYCFRLVMEDVLTVAAGPTIVALPS